MKKILTAFLGIAAVLAFIQPAIIAQESNSNQYPSESNYDGYSAAEKFLSSGVNKYNQGDKQGALADYNQLKQINPGYALAFVNRGVVRSTLGDRQGAMTDFNQAINLDPNFAQAYKRFIMRRC